MKQLMQRMFNHRRPVADFAVADFAVHEPNVPNIVELLPEPTVSANKPSPADVFLTDGALAINEARLCHLASLGLDLAGKKVLEVGGGIGLHTCFFESLGCDVLFTDARADNLAEARKRYPHRKCMQLDLDVETDLTRFGKFDIIYCYGTLYHLSKPSEALKALAQICDGMILLETCVTPGSEDSLHPEFEPSEVANQASSGLGCRPTRNWVLHRLTEYFGHAYQTVTQPLHGDFECNWLEPESRKLYRAVFVGSKTALAQETLSDKACTLQNTVPNENRGVCLDVGAHLGETSFEKAQQNPNLRFYAFEPNLDLACQRFNKLANYTMLPMAVGEHDGFCTFHLNSFAGASSLLPLDETRRQEWIGGELLHQEADVLVPTTRLDSFLEASGIAQVDFLKIDAQGADIFVVRSAGERLKDIRKIKLEVTTTPTQLYVGGATKEEFIKHLSSQGFALISEQSQTHGQEENLVFFQLGHWTKDTDPANLNLSKHSDAEWTEKLRPCTDEQLLALAKSVAELRPLVPYPGWSFGCSENSACQVTLLRKAIWGICNSRKLQTSIVFPWHDGSKLNLYLGNDVSYPTFTGGCIEPNEFAFISSYLKPGMMFVDIGANEGFFSMFASRRVGTSGSVVAFEPSSRELKRLRANVLLNGASNIAIQTCALSDANGTAELRICEYGHEGQNTLGDFAHAVVQAGTQQVELKTLDGYFEENAHDRLDFIKMDVEGAEQKVLHGARNTLERFKPVILLELNDRALQFQGACCESVVSLLRSLDYEIYNFSTSTGLPVLAESNEYSENIIAAPRGMKI